MAGPRSSTSDPVCTHLLVFRVPGACVGAHKRASTLGQNPATTNRLFSHSLDMQVGDGSFNCTDVVGAKLGVAPVGAVMPRSLEYEAGRVRSTGTPNAALELDGPRQDAEVGMSGAVTRYVRSVRFLVFRRGGPRGA